MLRTSLSKNVRNWPAIDMGMLHIILLGLVFALGIGLRLYDLGAESYWMDEVTMVRLASGDLDQLIVQTQRGRPPVFVFLAYAWVHLFGTAEVVTRMLPALAGIAGLGMIYAVGRELFNKQVALLSTFFMAIAEFQIQHAQNFRYYSLFVLVTLCSFFFLIRFLRTGKWSYLGLYVVATVLTFYTHTYGLFIIMAQGLYCLAQWRPLWSIRWKWFLSQALIGLGIGPGFFIAFLKTSTGESNVMQWVPDYSPTIIIVTFAKFVLPGREAPAVTTLALAIGFLCLATVGYIVWKGWPHWLTAAKNILHDMRMLTAQANSLLLVSLWLLCPVVVPFILGQIMGPMYLPRYAICAAPALYIVMALAVVSVQRVVPVIASVGVVAIVIGPGLGSYYTLDVNEQWRESVAYIESQSEPRDTVIFAPAEEGGTTILGGGLYRAFSWYYDGDFTSCGLNENLSGGNAIAESFDACVVEHDRFWLVLRGLPERTQPFKTFFLEGDLANVQLVEEQHFTDISVYLFELTQ